MTEPVEESAVTPAPPPPLHPTEPYPMWLLGLMMAIAVVGDVLLRETPWRFNLAIWIATLCWGGVGITGLYAKGAFPWAARLAFLAAGCFGLLYVLRDTRSVLLLALAAAVACILLGTAVAHGFRWTQAGLLEYVSRVPNTLRIMNATGSRFRVRLDHLASPGAASQTRVLLRGAALALPFLTVFGFLFARADARFLQFFNLDLTLEDVVAHLLCLSVCAVVGWVLLTAVYSRNEQLSPTDPLISLPPLRYGAVEVSIAVGLILALFGLFVALQLPYLFGGEAYMKSTENLTAADYARRGFFEMVSAGAFALLSVYFLDWLTRDDDARQRRWLHGLILGLLLLVAVVLVSAAHRMYVYVQLFGLTELRLGTLVFMAGLAALLVWMGRTVLRNKREQFASGALVVALLCVGLYAILNPHALIARVNAQRALDGKALDFRYAATLGHDAVPALVDLWLRTDVEPLRHDLRNLLIRKQEALPDTGWRTWNWGVHRAREALAQVR